MEWYEKPDKSGLRSELDMKNEDLNDIQVFFLWKGAKVEAVIRKHCGIRVGFWDLFLKIRKIREYLHVHKNVPGEGEIDAKRKKSMRNRSSPKEVEERKKDLYDGGGSSLYNCTMVL